MRKKKEDDAEDDARSRQAKGISVFVDAKEPNSVKLRHFGENDEQQSEGVEKEMIRLVLREKARQEEEDDGNDGEKLLSSGELHALIQLFPLRQISRFSLIHRHPRRPFGHMQQEKIANVMNGVGQGPSPGRAQPGIDEEQKMENNGDDDVSGPRSFGIEPGMIGIETARGLADDHGQSEMRLHENQVQSIGLRKQFLRIRCPRN